MKKNGNKEKGKFTVVKDKKRMLTTAKKCAW